MFEESMGFNQHLLSDDPDLRQGVLNWLERVFGYYGEEGGGVDVEIIAGQLLLLEKSVDYIYSSFTPLELKYQKGMRPLLDSVVAEVTDEGMDEMERMLSLMRRCRDNRDNARPGIVFDGGSEEDLLKRGAIMCNEIHRVFVCLCQIAGLPARLMGAHISGHMMSEIYVNGCWMWVDCMKGMYCFKDDGSPASGWDLKQDPSILDRQTREQWNDCRPVNQTGLPEFLAYERALMQAKARECYFNPREAICLGNYYVWEKDKYTFPWRTEDADPVRRHKAVIAEQRYRKEHGWPEHYFTPVLYEGELRTRDD